VLADRYNKELGQFSGRNRVLPVSLEQPVVNSHYSFATLGYAHPIVSIFRGNEDAGLLQTFVAKYFRVRLLDGEGIKPQVVLGFAETEGPAIVAGQVQRGRVTVVAIPASFDSVDRASGTPWSVMPAMQSFQPIVQEILAWTVRGQNHGRNSLVGEPISEALLPASDELSMTLFAPDGRTEQVRATRGGDETRWAFGETWWSGIYEVEPPGGGNRRLFAVNVDTRESDLAKLAPDELPPALIPLGQWQNLDEPTAGALAVRGELQRPLLYGALALLLFESCLAWFLGYRAS